MNELEKTLSEQESAIPQQNVIVGNEQNNGDSTLEETTSIVDADAANESSYQRYFAMTKTELIDDLQQITEAGAADRYKDVNIIKQAFYTIRKNEIEAECAKFVEEGNQEDTFVSSPDVDEARFKDLLNEFKEKRSAYLQAEEEHRQENLQLKHKIIEQIKAIVEDIDNINQHFPKFQQLQQDFKSITDIPASAVSDTWKDYQAAVELFYDHLKMNKELRDLDFKKNLAAKQTLIEDAKALENEGDVIVAFRKLQELHDQWREIGPVAKDLRESLWMEFKDASTVINKRHQDYFENRKETEAQNEEAKTKICEEIEAIDFEAIKGYKAWDETTKAIIDMQTRWKAIGFASRKNNNLLFARFRKSCDDFFARKAEYFKKTKEDFAANLEKKTALCEKAEALKECGDNKKAIEQIVALQAEWKKVGSVARKHSDAIWQRFMTACNYFFDEKKKQAAAVRQEENANLAAKREIIATLQSIAADSDKTEAVKLIREMQSKWSTIGHVPFKQKDKIYDEYRDVLKKLYDDFDIKETRARMTNFENQIDELKGDENKLYRERERLMRAYDQKRNELNTCENNLGFFNIKSRAGNSMLKDVERRIERIKEDMAMIEKKIELLNSKMG